MTTTPTTSKGEQAKSQLIAAAIAQFGEYGLHATTRDIAAQAGQNIAAITYYFGSKDDLYLACAQWIADFIEHNFRPHAQAAEALCAEPVPDKAAMRTLILGACQNMILLLTQDDTVNLSKFISREQLSPTPAYRLIHDQVIAPLHCYLTRLIAAYTGLNPDSTEMVLHTHALLGEVLAFRLGRETVLRRAGWAEFDRDKTAQIIEVITCHIDFVLEGLSQQKALTLYGNVDIRTVNLSFRVGGRLASLSVDEGDAIKAGQTLGELDRAPYENALQQAQANVSTAQAQYDLMMAGYRSEEIAQAAAAVNQAQAAYDYAQNFYQRQLGLRKSSAISANDLENARSSRDQAQATLKSAQDKLRQYRAGNRPQEIAQAKASLEQAQAALAQAKLDLHDTTLTSPSDGTLMTRAVEPGSMLSAGGTVMTLSLTHPVWVRAYIDEKNLGQAQPGREVLLYTDSRPDTPDLRTDLVYRLRIVVTDADDALRQGMPVTVTFSHGNGQ
ncbi:MAG: secretion protein HlyD [Klebsiella michiganensis]|nr:secretion protein HlyD [Klebsiella michiganensis]